MQNKKLNWCFKIKDGLKLIEPNRNLSKSYLAESKSTLARAQNDFNDKDLLWATVKIYYAEYYALYSFLQRIGIKCENHACSILAVGAILGEDKIKTINEHRSKRIDAQYYIRVEQESKVKNMLQEAKLFIAELDETISKISEKNIENHRMQLKETLINKAVPASEFKA